MYVSPASRQDALMFFTERTAKKMENEQGTFGMKDGLVRDTGSAVAMKLRLGFPVTTKDKCRQALTGGQR